MSEYALVEDGVCTQAIIADAEFVATLPGTWIDITANPGVGIGWFWDGATWTAPPELPETPSIAELQRIAEITAQKIQLQATTANQIESGVVTDEDLANLVYLYPLWAIGVNYAIGQVVRHVDGLYKVVQAHTSQAGWEPPAVPALFTAYRNATGPSPDSWVQPTGAQDAYAIGDRVTHDNPNDSSNIWIYESAIDGNTTEPGRDGTFDRWWTPIEAV